MKRVLLIVLALVTIVPMFSAQAVESVQQRKDRKQAEGIAALRAGIEALNKKDYDAAIVKFTEALDTRALPSVNVVDATFARGLAYFQKDDCVAALKDLDAVATAKEGDSQGHFVRSYCLDKGGDTAGSNVELEKAIKAAPDNPEFPRFRCVKNINAKNFAIALPDCERVVALKPDDAVIWLAVAQASELTGQKDKAKGAYQKLLALKPGDTFAVEGLKRLGS